MKDEKLVKLKKQLLSDFSLLGFEEDFTLTLRGYSKSYYGRYVPCKKEIIIYALEECGDVMDYDLIIDTLIHEYVHHYQYNHQKDFVRLKGVMHNQEFYKLFNNLMGKLDVLGVITFKAS